MSTNYLVKKALVLLSSLFIVITITFFLMRLIPGDPFIEDQALTEEASKALKHYYGLDQPLYQQYLQYITAILHFDFGSSLKYQSRTVAQIISEGFPVSFALGIQALILALFGGLLCGAFAALYHDRSQDRFTVAFFSLFLSIPAFLAATLLQFVFAMQLDMFPVARWGSFDHTVLPSLALALFPGAYIAKLTRAGLIEVAQQDYILTARSKGLSEFEILCKHVLRNAILPVIAYSGSLTATIFTGSFVIEKIFGIPGLGGWLVASINNRDYPVVMGITIFYSFLLMSCNFLVDCLYYLIDPSIRTANQSHG